MVAGHIVDLLSTLSGGWPPGDYAPVDGLLGGWRDRVGPIEIVEREANKVVFRASLPGTRLRGADRLVCLLIGGSIQTAGRTAAMFVRVHGAPGRLLLLFCVTPPAFDSVRAEVRCDRCLVCSPSEVESTWSAEAMGAHLAAMLRTRFPIDTLMPYDIAISASGPMFYGRQAEVKKLLQDDGGNFAVTGAGRIGKTSLVKRYMALLSAKSDPSRHVTHYIDLYDNPDRRTATLARKIAMEIEPGRRADRMVAGDLADFLEYQRHRLRIRPTLIFDEVDDACSTSLFREQLAGPVRQEHCRVILVGKGGLLKFTKDNSIPLASRLRVLRLREIDAESAQRLFIEPIHDLGLEVESFEEVFELVKRQTGCLPHMIQFYGQRLVEIAGEQATRRITRQHVEQLRWDFNTANFFLSPLDDLKKFPLARFLALALLKEHKDGTVITPARIQDVGKMHRFDIPHSDAIEIGDTLVIQNILSWSGDGYRLANGALPEYAGKMGYLTRGFEEAKRTAAARPRWIV